MMDDEIELERQRECGPFHVCQTIAELLVLVNAMIGIDAVDKIKRVGLIDLAKLTRRHARKAPSKPDRRQTDSAKVWLAKQKRSREQSRGMATRFSQKDTIPRRAAGQHP